MVVYVQPPARQTLRPLIFLFSPEEKWQSFCPLSHSSVLQITHVNSALAENEIISMNKKKTSPPSHQLKMLLIQLGLFQEITLNLNISCQDR